MKLNEFNKKKKLEDMTNDELYARCFEAIDSMNAMLDEADERMENERAAREERSKTV